MQVDPDRPAGRGAPPGEVAPRRDARLPAFVRARDLRLGRHGRSTAGTRWRARCWCKTWRRKPPIEPIRGLPVLKDLIVDMDPFFEGYRACSPTCERRGRAGQGAAPVTGGTRAVRRHDEVHPVRRVHDVVPDLLGRRDLRRPGRHRERAPVHLRLARPRARANASKILSEKTGVFRCRTTFNCTDACPRGIQVTKAIQEVKRAILFDRF